MGKHPMYIKLLVKKWPVHQNVTLLLTVFSCITCNVHKYSFTTCFSQ